jgi:DNA-binding response OmpR family regulator
MEGDREKCLAAGMDDYVGKPVRLPDLQAVMERWQAGRSGNGSEEASKLKSIVRTDNRRKMLAISNSGKNS